MQSEGRCGTLIGNVVTTGGTVIGCIYAEVTDVSELKSTIQVDEDGLSDIYLTVPRGYFVDLLAEEMLCKMVCDLDE